ncbi:MAG: peptidoglycan/LPS O-acetylase OafA/YrhL [Dokdonia sp.]|jgi:peptidoglycan/LPS O-acetylase OafA/YrhL
MLAYWVMIFHLISIPLIGQYAVFSFYVLSGFLMTTIMHETYGYHFDGLKSYATNRFLRLYPIYWAVLIFSIIIVLLVSEPYSIKFKDSIRIPINLEEALYNVTMIYPALSPGEIQPRLSPSTWALTVEIFFYICIGLGISKTRERSITWLSVSVLYFIISYAASLSDSHRYFTILAASLPFSLGAIAYHFKKDLIDLAQTLKISSPLSILILYISHALIFCIHKYYMPFSYSNLINEVGIYSNLILSLFSVIALYYNGEELFNKRFDRLIGDFSYPIYLCHWQCGLLASYLLYDIPTKGQSIEGVKVAALSTIFVLIISVVLIKLIDNNIAAIRTRIKKNL